jgi:hypothetical protein
VTTSTSSVRAGPEHLELRRVVLRVAVGVGDELLGRRGEPRAQRAAVAAILADDGSRDLRVGPGQLVGDLARGVLLPSLTTITSKSGVSRSATCTVRMTRLAIVPASLYAGKNTLRPGGCDGTRADMDRRA